MTANGNKIARVLLADDHSEMLNQTGNVLAAEFEIIGTVTNGVGLVKATAELDPDVVVLDISMPLMDGIEAAWHIQVLDCRAKVVFLTIHEDPDYVRAAIRSGGAGYVVKSRMATDLVAAIHEVLAGRRFVSPTIHLDVEP